jgi:hypothetical protein
MSTTSVTLNSVLTFRALSVPDAVLTEVHPHFLQ